MVSRSTADLGPSLVEMLFKAASIAALTLLVCVPVLPVVGLVILEVVVPDASMGDAFDVAILLALLALGITLGAVVWSIWRDLADRRQARSRGRMPG